MNGPRALGRNNTIAAGETASLPSGATVTAFTQPVCSIWSSVVWRATASI